MVKPSLRAHDADLFRIVFPKSVSTARRPAGIAGDEQLLTEHLIGRGISIVFVDPIMSTIAATVK